MCDYIYFEKIKTGETEVSLAHLPSTLFCLLLLIVFFVCFLDFLLFVYLFVGLQNGKPSVRHTLFFLIIYHFSSTPMQYTEICLLFNYLYEGVLIAISQISGLQIFFSITDSLTCFQFLTIKHFELRSFSKFSVWYRNR